MGYNREMPEQQKQKIASANQGKVRSQATKDAISKAMTGKTHTDETKAKIVKGIKAVWDRVPKEKKENTNTNPLGF